MKKTLLAFAASAMLLGAAAAQAQGVTGSANIGGQLTTFGTQVTGSVGAVGSGNSISAAETDGYGQSIQSGSSVGGSQASIGSNVSISGITVGANTSQWSSATTTGNISGNSPTYSNDGSSIENGSAALGKGNGSASIGGNFQQTAVGAGIGVNGNFNVSAIGD